MKKYIAITHEPGKYDDKVRYEFESAEDMRNFFKAMQGVLICSEAFCIRTRK